MKNLKHVKDYDNFKNVKESIDSITEYELHIKREYTKLKKGSGEGLLDLGIINNVSKTDLHNIKMTYGDSNVIIKGGHYYLKVNGDKKKVNERKISVKNAQLFKEQIDSIAKKFGAIKNEDEKYKMYDYSIDTKVGKLFITIYDRVGSELYSIFMRFEEPERAKELVDCNQYTGKWNIHEQNYDEILLLFDNALENVTGKKI